MGCPSLNELFDFARERIAPPEREAVEAHLSTGCSRCKENYGWLAEVLRLTAEDRSFDFPEEVIMSVAAWMRPQPTATRTPLRQLVAQLVFDSLMSRQFADVRGELTTAGATGRQMLYHVEGYDVDLRFERTEDGEVEELIGQILAQGPAEAGMGELTVRLLRDQVEVGRTRTHAGGIFKFAPIPSGVYDLRIEVSGLEIIVSQAGSARAS
jgi:hypothetical protein